MLVHNIAVPSCSSWASPCLLGTEQDPQKDKITKPDSFPLSCMDDCVVQVGSSKFVIKCDLLKGCWQVLLSKRAQEVASFIPPSGIYLYKVMPFGQRNAPATFQRLMNRVVDCLEGCAEHLDYAVIYSDAWENHGQHIEALFDRLAWAHLTIDLAKYDFARAVVMY